MAEQTSKEDVADAGEYSDSDDVSSMEEFRRMITRPDWLQVFKKTNQETFAELQNKSEVIVPSILPEFSPPVKQRARKKRHEADEVIVPPIPPEFSPPVKQRARKKGRPARSAKKPANIEFIPVPTTPLISVSPAVRRSKRIQTKPQASPPKKGRSKGRRDSQTRKDKKKGRQASQRRKETSTRCVQSSTCENDNREIVFLSDSESEIRTVQTREVHHATNIARVPSLDDSIEVISVNSHKGLDDDVVADEDKEITIFFCWRNKFLKLPMKQNAQFGTVVSTICDSWEVPGAVVTLLHNDEIIRADDTPSTHEMLSGSIIECSIAKSRISVDMTDPNVITIKLQTKNSREKKSMAVHQMAPFQSIIEQFAKEEGIPVDKVVFKFDGDTISPTDTPFGLDIEDNYSIDVTY